MNHPIFLDKELLSIRSPNYLIAGGCYEKDNSNSNKNNNTLIRCALKPNECQNDTDDEIYRSSYWMQLYDDDNNNRACSDRSTIRGLRSLGRCVDNNGNDNDISSSSICTSHKSACDINISQHNTFNDSSSVSFRELDPTCTIYGGKSGSIIINDEEHITHSIYGYCTSSGEDDGKKQTQQQQLQQHHQSSMNMSNINGFCAWQSDECDTVNNNYTWHSAMSYNVTPSVCSAEKVITGACVDATNRSNFFCAVASEVCDNDDDDYDDHVFEYVKAYDLLLEENQICFLIDDTNITSSSLPGDDNVGADTTTTTTNNNNTTNNITAIVVDKNSDGEFDDDYVIGIIVGVLIIVVNLIVAVFFVYRKHKKRLRDNAMSGGADHQNRDTTMAMSATTRNSSIAARRSMASSGKRRYSNNSINANATFEDYNNEAAAGPDDNNNDAEYNNDTTNNYDYDDDDDDIASTEFKQFVS